MNRLFILTMASTLALPTLAAKPFVKGLHPMEHTAISTRVAPLAAAAREAAAATLLSEDFSAFTQGSETAPAPEIEYVNADYIPDELTSTPGWVGHGIHPAGGAVALMKWTNSRNEEKFGFITTPQMDLGGTATLSFRARNLTEAPSSLWISLCNDEYGPGEDQIDIPLSNEWKSYTFIASYGSLEWDSYFQIQTEMADALIDDIRIDFKRDRLLAPEPEYAINNSPTSFTASWNEVKADRYLLSVVCTAQPENSVKDAVKESFDGLHILADGKTVDKTDPSYPEGWDISLVDNSTADVTTEAGTYHSAPLALVFDSENDAITSPATPEPISGLKFWVRPSSTEEDPVTASILRVEIYHSLTDSWENIAQLPYYWMVSTGGFYEFQPDAFGEDATRVRLSMIQKGAISFYVDDIVIDYSTRGIRSMLLEDFPVLETSYTVDNIVPENDYHFYVKAQLGDLVSPASDLVWVDGLNGLKPTALPASDISTHSFTANWQPMPHASVYDLTLSKTISAAEDLSDVTILEENFDDIPEEGSDWVSPYNFADRGWASTGWCATQPQWAPGMAGTSGTSWIGAAGLVFSPRLNLEGAKKSGLHVKANVVTTMDVFRDENGDPYLDNGNTLPEGIFAMIIRSHTDTQALAAAVVDMPSKGANVFDGVIELPADIDLKDVVVAFMSKTGSGFFVDDVRLSADLPAGAEITAPLLDTSTESTSLHISDLDAGTLYTYRVKGSTSRNYVDYASEYSDPIEVRLEQSSVAAVEAAGNEDAEYFNLQGLRVVNPTEGIYIRRQGDKAVKVLIRR